MFTPWPNDSGEALEIRPLKGVLGLPNSCMGWKTFPSADGGAGVAPSWKCAAFLEGVSGMCELAKFEDCISTFLFRLEIRPVEWNALGFGFAILKAAGVAYDSSDDWRVPWSLSVARVAPIGKEREKPGSGRKGSCAAGAGISHCCSCSCSLECWSSTTLDVDEEGVNACESG